MSITVSLAVSIFLLGAAVGALLTRLQWIAFQPEGFEGNDGTTWGRAARRKRNKILPSERSQIHRPYADDSRAGLKKLLEENQMEIARILREVQALWSAMGSFGNAPDMTQQYAYGDGTSDR